MAAAGDFRGTLAAATLDAVWAGACPTLVVLATDLGRADRAFADQGSGHGARYCWIEAGAIAQNLHLAAASAGLGTVLVGGIDDAAMRSAVESFLPPTHSVPAVMPLGYPDDAAR